MTGDDGQKVRIVCVPAFSDTGEIVLVNLSTLESEVIKFSSGKMSKVDEDTTEPGNTVMDDIEEL
jgi:DNA polymerase II small subunit/DNA polymerase delta subunit B